MAVTNTNAGLLHVEGPYAVRLLFMAPYAPDAPDYQVNPYIDDGSYPQYHYETFKRLRRLGFRVESTSKPYAIVHAGGAVDYVFSLFNRMSIRNSEVFVSAYCEYLHLPYLGGPPNVRAAAEDKYISKLIAQAAGIPVPRGVPFQRGVTPLKPVPFAGPYFVKDRFGAASEMITTDNMQPDWQGASKIVTCLWDAGTDALVEEYIDGIDITVPVIGDDTPRVLGAFHPRSDKQGNILTADLKLTDHLGYGEIEVSEKWVHEDPQRIWDALGAIDYFRIDYRFDPIRQRRRFLEINICCYLGKDGPFGLAAKRDGYGIDALVDHVIAYSLRRQDRRVEKRERIL